MQRRPIPVEQQLGLDRQRAMVVLGQTMLGAVADGQLDGGTTTESAASVSAAVRHKQRLIRRAGLEPRGRTRGRPDPQ